MAKVIKYKFLSAEVNHGTEETPDVEQIVLDSEITCKTQAAYDANYPIAEKEAIPGTITVEGEFDPEPEPVPGAEELAAENEDMRSALGVLGVTV